MIPTAHQYYNHRMSTAPRPGLAGLGQLGFIEKVPPAILGAVGGAAGSIANSGLDAVRNGMWAIFGAIGAHAASRAWEKMPPELGGLAAFLVAGWLQPRIRPATFLD